MPDSNTEKNIGTCIGFLTFDVKPSCKEMQDVATAAANLYFASKCKDPDDHLVEFEERKLEFLKLFNSKWLHEGKLLLGWILDTNELKVM